MRTCSRTSALMLAHRCWAMSCHGVVLMIMVYVVSPTSVLAQATARNSNGSQRAFTNPALGRLLPMPRQIEESPQPSVLSGSAAILVEGPDVAACRFIGERLSSMIEEEFSVRLPVEAKGVGDVWRLCVGNEPDKQSAAEKAKPQEKWAAPERYRLDVGSEGSCAVAQTRQGLLWAAMTFRQLLEKRDRRLAVIGVRIDDWPRYRWRGFMIDSGRSPNSMPQIKRIVRVCSAFKLNCLVFREGDDELCAVRYRTNKLGRENPYAFTMDQVKELVDYCEQYGIAVIPEIESLGHSTAKGFAYPELVQGGFEQKYEGVGVHIRKANLNPENPRSLELLESIYDEWIPLLRSPFMHLGLDEVRLPKEVQARHMEKLLPLVERVAKRHGRTVTPLVWADAPPTPEGYRDRVVRVPWEYGDGQQPVGLDNKHLMNQRIGDLCAAGCQEQVFMAGGSGSKHTPYAKTDYESAFSNLATWAMLGNSRPNFIGLIAVQWHGNMLDLWLPDFLTAADVAWNPPSAIPEFAAQMDRTKANLARIRDAARPEKEEVDRPAWDGIWLKGQKWDRNVVTTRP
jgi:hypothetical protein